MGQNEFDVAIVGDGIIAKACALSLNRFNLNTALITQKISPTRAERFFALSCKTQELLSQIDVWPKICAEDQHPILGMEIFLEQDPIPTLNFSAYASALHQLAFVLSEKILLQKLDAALRASTITWIDDALMDWQHDEQFLQLNLNTGRILSAECLVGADGAHSHVRQHAQIKATKTAYQQKAIVAQLATTLPHRGIARQWFIDSDILALLPLSPYKITIVWSVREAMAEQLLGLSSEKFVEKISAISALHTGDMQLLSPALAYPLVQQQTQSLIAEKVVLLGDAAHVIHPLAGQGMNLGFRDIAALTKVLANKHPLQFYGDRRLLRLYELERVIDIALTTKVIHALYRGFSSGPLLKKIFGFGMQTLQQVSYAKKRLINYATR